MKDAVIPPVRVETELRASLDAVLRPGETLTDFVEAAVRNAVEYRRVQTEFASRCDASLAEHERTGVSIPAAKVIAKLESKLAMPSNSRKVLRTTWCGSSTFCSIAPKR